MRTHDYKFSDSSTVKLKELDPQLQQILQEAIKYTDFSIICGFRNESDQHKAFLFGVSKLDWPYSKHNQTPSKAVDLMPYPSVKDDVKDYCYLAGIVCMTAHNMGIPLRWGGDWNMNGQVHDESFQDLGHFELL